MDEENIPTVITPQIAPTQPARSNPYEPIQSALSHPYEPTPPPPPVQSRKKGWIWSLKSIILVVVAISMFSIGFITNHLIEQPSDVQQALQDYCQKVINDPPLAFGYLSSLKQPMPTESEYEQGRIPDSHGFRGFKECHSVAIVDTNYTANNMEITGYALGTALYLFNDETVLIHQYTLFRRTTTDAWHIDPPRYNGSSTY